MNVRLAHPQQRRVRLQGISWRRYRLLLIGGFLVGLVILSALLADVISPYSPYDIDVANKLQPPSGAHWLGTDEIGRDVLSRIIHAARISVKVGTVAVSVGLIVGAIIGIIAGYFGGLVDMALMRFMELLFSFPAILLAIVLMAALGTSILNAMTAIGIIFIPGFSRLARAATQEVLRQQYIEAAHTIGM
jgi:peptide/nickel transport system permease protein